MILGDSFLADGARQAFPHVPFTWVLDHPTLCHRPYHGPTVISTPIRVGTITALEAMHPDATFAYVPENVRQLHPEDWRTQTRWIIGCRDRNLTRELSQFFHPAITMTPEEAEMVKHGINGFFAHTIQFAQQLARICREQGADPDQVADGIMSDPRIGYGAYLRPEGDLGPNLQREVDTLKDLGWS